MRRSNALNQLQVRFGASLVESRKGRDALLKYVDACFEHQETYMNAALGDARKSDVDAVFATIAEKSGVLPQCYAELDTSYVISFYYCSLLAKAEFLHFLRLVSNF